MASALENVHAVSQQGTVGNYASTDRSAYHNGRCAACGAGQFVVVARVAKQTSPGIWDVGTQWLRCVACARGSVLEGGVTYPTTQPLRVPQGLPPIDQTIWEEVRSCLGVGAHAAAVMLCRKLLFHIAVSHGLPPKDDNDRAPNFYQAVEHLQSEGLITPKMRPWVNRIKDVGNDANHELAPITPEVALDVATFTEQLLVLAYEFDALMGQQDAHDDES